MQGSSPKKLAISDGSPLSPLEQIRLAREVLTQESEALIAIAEALGLPFSQAVELILETQGSIIVTGMGKAGLIGQKIMATLASTGTIAHFLHPSEAIHGDLGRVGPKDAILVLSQSGETEEILRILPTLRKLNAPVIAITASEDNSLGKASDIVLELGDLEEACYLGLAPSTSTTAMLALGDALALVVSKMKDFKDVDFAQFHPAGSLGRKLANVEDCMRPLDQCRITLDTLSVRNVLVGANRNRRRIGATMLVNQAGELTGLFTDSDFAKIFESNSDECLGKPISEVMTRSPLTIEQGSRLTRAVEIFTEKKISELPVVDENQRPVGILDITDLFAIFPRLKEEPLSQEEPVEEPPVACECPGYLECPEDEIPLLKVLNLNE